jgi:hypothetical protein
MNNTVSKETNGQFSGDIELNPGPVFLYIDSVTLFKTTVQL